MLWGDDVGFPSDKIVGTGNRADIRFVQEKLVDAVYFFLLERQGFEVEPFLCRSAGRGGAIGERKVAGIESAGRLHEHETDTGLKQCVVFIVRPIDAGFRCQRDFDIFHGAGRVNRGTVCGGAGDCRGEFIRRGKDPVFPYRCAEFRVDGCGQGEGLCVGFVDIPDNITKGALDGRIGTGNRCGFVCGEGSRIGERAGDKGKPLIAKIVSSARCREHGRYDGDTGTACKVFARNRDGGT